MTRLFTGRGKARMYSKVAKKGGSKVLLAVVNTHQKQPKILVSALSIIVPLAAVGMFGCSLDLAHQAWCDDMYS